MPSAITHHSPTAPPDASSPTPSVYKTVLIGILGALIGCVVATSAVWLGRGTPIIYYLFVIPGFATAYLLSWLLAPIVTTLEPEGGAAAGVMFISLGALAFWALVFGLAAAWWYHRRHRR